MLECFSPWFIEWRDRAPAEDDAVEAYPSEANLLALC